MEYYDDLIDQFNNEYNLRDGICYSFAEKFKSICESLNITKEDFVEKVGLNEDTFKNYMQGKKDPSLRGLTAFCLAYEIDPLTFQNLLWAGGYSINLKKKRDCAYHFLITNCMSFSVKQCNELLKQLGIKDCDLLPIPYAEQ